MPVHARGYESQILRSVREAAQTAPSLEDALRAALQRICTATGWQAGRVELAREAGARIVWHLDRPERLLTLRRVAERRRRPRTLSLATQVLRDGAPQWRPDSEDDVGADLRLPRGGSPATLAAVEFFASAKDTPDDDTLAGIATACAELGGIIERKPAEEALRKVERGYRELFESVGEALIVVDPQSGTVLDANPRAAAVYRVSRSQLIGTKVHALWSDAALAQKAISRGSRFETSPRGSEVVLEVSASPVTFNGAAATLLLSREVTQRVRVIDALRASEERYRVLFENNPQPMWVEDADSGSFLAVNDAAVRHYGWSREKFMTLKSSDLRLDPGAAAEQRNGTPSVERHRTASGEAHDLEFVGPRGGLRAAPRLAGGGYRRHPAPQGAGAAAAGGLLRSD